MIPKNGKLLKMRDLKFWLQGLARTSGTTPLHFQLHQSFLVPKYFPQLFCLFSNFCSSIKLHKRQMFQNRTQQIHSLLYVELEVPKGIVMRLKKVNINDVSEELCVDKFMSQTVVKRCKHICDPWRSSNSYTFKTAPFRMLLTFYYFRVTKGTQEGFLFQLTNVNNFLQSHDFS